VPVRNATANRAEPLGFENVLWKAADKLRSSMDASEYKHVVLGLIFLKYVDDAFEEGVFQVPPEARWGYLRERAEQPEIGKLIDHAMGLIEADNPGLREVLPKAYARLSLDVRRLGELVDLISTIGFGKAEHREKDLLGRAYEYFLGRFASAEGKSGGEFYTPRPVVKLLVEMIEPLNGRVYDPCCGSGGMFVQSERFIEAHGGHRGDIAVYGQELNDTTWRLARMNLAIRGIEVDLGPRWGDTFHNDLHPDLKADYILANPPFNVSDWGGERLREDPRWRFGAPPTGNANFAWVQHFIHHLSPHGTAGFVLANGPLSSNQAGEGAIRQRLVEADLIDCIVSLPSQLFYSTQIAASLWFVTRDKHARTGKGGVKHGDRTGRTLFIDARHSGVMVDRTHRELADQDIDRIASNYKRWRSREGTYQDVPGFCREATIDDIRAHRYALVPGRYVGFAHRPSVSPSDRTRFLSDLDEIEQQVEQAGSLARSAITRIREVLNG
jgi:type I restriction enzyme M protein